MIDPISKRIIKPHDCVLAFGLPTTRADFERTAKQPEGRDFVVNCCSDVDYYERQVLSEMENTVPNILGLGVQVVPNVNSALLPKLFNEYVVTILFCHSVDSKLELDDGLISAEQLVAQIPLKRPMIIDLCACWANDPAKAISKMRPSCLVRFSEVNAQPGHWLYFFWALFKLLADNDMTYLEAFDATVELFIE